MSVSEITSQPLVTAQEVSEAAERLQGRIRHTPLLRLAAGELCDVPLVLKLEQLQKAASFKARGAFNSLLAAPQRPGKVIAASGGNHGIAVALAAGELGIDAEIFVPSISAPAKVQRLQELGARVHQGGEDYAEALEAMYIRKTEIEQQGEEVLEVHAYDQPNVLAGQGTVAKEFEADAPEVDSFFIAVGGGGLIGGCLAWLGGRKKVIAVEPRTSQAYNAALEAGAPCDVTVAGVAADALGARKVGQISFDLAQAYPSGQLERILVEDDEIVTARRLLWDRCRLMVEPSGAAALAAVISGRYKPAQGEQLGILVCGANCDPASLS
ncbi:threonine/serine dehydratase [Rhodovibrionaceae bacterium A322]